MSFLNPQSNKTKTKCQQLPLLSRIDLGDTQLPSLLSWIDCPPPEQLQLPLHKQGDQAPSLLSRIDLSNVPLLDRMQLPMTTKAPPLLMRTGPHCRKR